MFGYKFLLAFATQQAISELSLFERAVAFSQWSSNLRVKEVQKTMNYSRGPEVNHWLINNAGKRELSQLK